VHPPLNEQTKSEVVEVTTRVFVREIPVAIKA
jgi:hypothetical protein